MGNWNINIQGIGAHHNTATDTPRDAEKLAAEFVEKLKAAGQKIEWATITYGSCDDLGGENFAEIAILKHKLADKRSPV